MSGIHLPKPANFFRLYKHKANKNIYTAKILKKKDFKE